MKDRYLYRGKRLDNGEWLVGSLDVYCDETACICTQGKNFKDESFLASVPIDPDSIGQCTGLKDKHDKLIFEGDIIHYKYDPPNHVYMETIAALKYDGLGFLFSKNKRGGLGGYLVSWPAVWDSNSEKAFVKIIGNIHDNPELLEVGE